MAEDTKGAEKNISDGLLSAPRTFRWPQTRSRSTAVQAAGNTRVHRGRIGDLLSGLPVYEDVMQLENS
jgi:hypothetical protein